MSCIWRNRKLSLGIGVQIGVQTVDQQHCHRSPRTRATKLPWPKLRATTLPRSTCRIGSIPRWSMKGCRSMPKRLGPDHARTSKVRSSNRKIGGVLSTLQRRDTWQRTAVVVLPTPAGPAIRRIGARKKRPSPKRRASSSFRPRC